MSLPSRVDVLADPINAALRGPQREFARTSGAITRFAPEVSVFFGHPSALSADDYRDVERLASADGTVLLRDRSTPLPASWSVLETFGLVQYLGDAVPAQPDSEAIVLTPADVPEMTDLVRRTNPGPFLPRTIELGTFLGIRDDSGRLIAMAGERLRPPGWTEISGVCTAPEARGRGLARRLISAIAAEIHARGDLPFLHTSDDNPARKLYESMGFTPNGIVPLEVVQVQPTTLVK